MDRRNAIKSIAVAGAAAALPKFSAAEVGKKSQLKVGLVGCSGRGIGAVENMLQAANGSVKIVAIADLFADRNDLAIKAFERYAKKFGKDTIDVPTSRRFSGWDAYKQILGEDIDIIIHATPPVFRPLHIREFVKAGKHLFVEKPACVDPVQCREMLEIADEADKKGLTIIPGIQRRFHAGYQEAIKRMQDGQIGEVLGAQAYWLNSRFFIQDNGVLRLQNPDPEEMEYQIRNWFIFRWTSGDCYVEQHVHNLDVILWGLGKDPKEVCGIGGRRWDIEFPKYGDRFSEDMSMDEKIDALYDLAVEKYDDTESANIFGLNKTDPATGQTLKQRYWNRESLTSRHNPLNRGSRNLVGIAIQLSDSEEEKLFVHDSMQVSPE